MGLPSRLELSFCVHDTSHDLCVCIMFDAWLFAFSCSVVAFFWYKKSLFIQIEAASIQRSHCSAAFIRSRHPATHTSNVKQNGCFPNGGLTDILKTEHAYDSRVSNKEVHDKINIIFNKGTYLHISWQEFRTNYTCQVCMLSELVDRDILGYPKTKKLQYEREFPLTECDHKA